MALRGWEDLDTRCQAVNHSPVLGLVHSAPKIHHHPNRPQRASPSLIRREVTTSSPGSRPAASHAPATCPASLGPPRPASLREAPPRPPPRGLTLQARRNSSSIAADWCGAASPTRAPRAGRTTPSSQPAESWRWRPSSVRRLSAGRQGPGVTRGSRWATRGSLSRLSRLMKTRWTSFHVVRNAGSLSTSIPDPSSSILKDLHFQ